MGGTISGLYGINRPGEVTAILLSSPGMGFKRKITSLQRTMVKVIAAIFPQKVLPSGIEPVNICHDPEVVAKYLADPLLCLDTTASWLKAFDAAAAEVVARASEFKSPCLIMQAGGDLLVDPERTREFYDRVTSTDKTFRLYENYYHEIMNEPQKYEVLEEMWEWISRRLND
jgi:alpha-beta hydrolase superfamily lysophospholipase